MRRVVVGNGPDGRSTVVRDAEPALVYRFSAAESAREPHSFDGVSPETGAPFAAQGEVLVMELWATGQNHLDHEAATPKQPFEVECPTGGSRWRLVTLGAKRTSSPHRTRTTDHNYVVAGEVELILEDGSRTLLTAGDIAVLPGTVHAWSTRDVACTMLIFMIDRPEPGWEFAP